MLEPCCCRAELARRPRHGRSIGRLSDAAVLMGLVAPMLETTVEYVTERRQFGVPVGSFQAVKHHLANAGAAVEFAEPLVRHAAHLLSGGTNAMATSWSDRIDQQVAVSMAKARASTAGQLVSETSLQCHGAIGYTVEADLQLFMKRAWALSRSHGDAYWHRGRACEGISWRQAEHAADPAGSVW